MPNEMTIKSATLHDDGTSLQLLIVVRNPGNRTRHVYSSVRALRYDAATKSLEVQMSDHGLMEPRDRRAPPQPNETSTATFIVPRIVDVAPGTETELTLRIPRTITHIDPTKSAGAVLKFVTEPIHEAQTIQVDVAWSDTPFYADPRRPFEMRKQLTEWVKGVARHVIKRNAEGGTEPPPERKSPKRKS